MSEETKQEIKIEQLSLDEGIDDENPLKSDGDLSETNADVGEKKPTSWPFIVTTRKNHDIVSDDHGNDRHVVLESHEIDQSIVPKDIGNDHDIVSGDYDNKNNVSVDHEIDDGIVSGDHDNKDNVSVDHEIDDGIVSGDHDNKDNVSVDHEIDDGIVSGDYDNYTVADEEDFSIKKLFSCIGRKPKNKDKNPYQTLTEDKVKQPPFDPFRQTQWKLHNTINQHGVNPSHPSIQTMRCDGGHISGIRPTGASIDSLIQSGKSNPGNINMGNIHVEESLGRGHFVNNPDVSHTICIDPDLYDFSHPHRGHAVLIVNQFFRKYDPRNGADVDIQNTTKVLQKLGYHIKNKEYSDLDKKSTLSILQDAKDADHSKMDSFAFIISSHGNEIENPQNGKKEHAIYCSDDQYIFTSDILEMFNDTNCPSLKEKPKLFFIQACRGTNTDSGVEMIITKDDRNHKQEHSDIDKRDFRSYHDGENTEREPVEPVMNAESDPLFGRVQSEDDTDAKGFGNTLEDRPIVHCNNDCLVMYAIPSGHFAWRSNVDGSWMLQYLWEEVKNYDLQKPYSFLKVLTAVNRKMANRETNVPKHAERSGKKAIPVIIHQLDKDIVFQEKPKKYIGYTKAMAI